MNQYSMPNNEPLLVVCSKITITKLPQPWNDSELFIQCHINLRSYNLQGREPLANTMDSFRCLNHQEPNQLLENQMLMLVVQHFEEKRKLTEMRLRKIMRFSGTPFFMRSSIAWFAELPRNTRDSHSYKLL